MQEVKLGGRCRRLASYHAARSNEVPMPQSSPVSTAAPLGRAGLRRYVTVFFSDVSGSSEHAEQMEAEEYADVLARFRELARDIVPRHGGSIARLQGDG